MSDRKLVAKSLYLENLEKEIIQKFEAGLRVVEVQKVLTFDQQTQILFKVALRNLQS